MEFIDLSRYLEIKKPFIPTFSQLRQTMPVLVSQDLQIVYSLEGIGQAEKLASQGFTVVPVKKEPPLKSFKKRTTFPRRVMFEMTSRCNFLCRMCPMRDMKRPQMDMDTPTYKHVVDEINHYGIEGLWVYNLGEPFLHPDCYDILNYIGTKHNLGVIWISTNGYRFSEDDIRTILKSCVWYLNFSAHAVTEETYDTVCSPGKFRTVQANLEKWYQLKGVNDLPRKPYLHCQMIEQETTKHEIDAFIQKHYKRADVVSVNMLEYVNLPNNAFGHQRPRKPLMSCTRVSRGDCFIFSNGDVTVCDPAYDGDILLGNVHKQSLYDIWNGPERTRLLELNKQGKMDEIEFCRKCTDYDI